MPKLTGDALLQRAIPLGANDRVSLSDAYARNQPEYKQFREEAKSFEALIGKKLKDLSPAERKVALAVFVAAEQWEESLADSNHKRGPVADACMRNVRLFREFRHAEWGRTQMEVILADAPSVDIRDLMDTPKKERAKP
jgi:hypothetical protein